MAGLRLELNGEDMTGADSRLTQALIEEKLSVNLLSRAAFHGQADITSLLEARPRIKGLAAPKGILMRILSQQVTALVPA